MWATRAADPSLTPTHQGTDRLPPMDVLHMDLTLETMASPGVAQQLVVIHMR